MFDSTIACLQRSRYQRVRAVMATLNNAALLLRPEYAEKSLSQIASEAIESADALLDRLGIVDPDRRA